MNWKVLLVSIAVLPGLVFDLLPAEAGSAWVFQSPSGDTVFPENTVGCAGDIIRYSTRYQGKAYQGKLRIQSPSGQGCEGGRGRWIQGSFEERSQDGAELCRGRLSLYLTLDPRGGSTVQWSNIQAAPGYRCSGSGTSPKLPLSYTPIYHD